MIVSIRKLKYFNNLKINRYFNEDSMNQFNCLIYGMKTNEFSD